MIREAEFSADRAHRFTLVREWEEPLIAGWGGEPAQVLFIGLNPSTADEREDDPTVRRMIGFARSWHHSRLVVCNLFAFRATKPRDLWLADDPMGPGNHERIEREARRSELVVAAWGSQEAPRRRGPLAGIAARNLLVRLTRAGSDVHCLGETAGGMPRHPLYVKGDTGLCIYARGQLPAERPQLRLA